MSKSTQFAAEILEAGASAYAGLAASLLIERRPEVEQRYAPSAMRFWKENLRQHAIELSAALGAEAPDLFARRFQWTLRAFQARHLETSDLHAGVACLSDVLKGELPEAARATVAGYLDPALSSWSEAEGRQSREQPGRRIGIDVTSPNGRLALRYLQAVLEGDSRSAIDLVVAAADAGAGFEELYLEVLLAAQHEIGEMWHVADVAVAEEHHLTATTERAMAILVQRTPCREAVGKTVVLAGVAGNSHGLGARAVADFFEIAGWRSICLGGDLPAPEMATAATYFEADLAVLSVALATQLKAAGQAVEAVRAEASSSGREIKILVGGAAFEDQPDLWRRCGADGYAPCAASAVELGGQLVGLDAG